MPRLHVPLYQRWRVYVFSAARKNARLVNGYPVANTSVDSGWSRSGDHYYVLPCGSWYAVGQYLRHLNRPPDLRILLRQRSNFGRVSRKAGTERHAALKVRQDSMLPAISCYQGL